MAIETLEDILEELADKFGLCGEERNEWTIRMGDRIVAAVLSGRRFRKPRFDGEAPGPDSYNLALAGYGPPPRELDYGEEDDT